MCRISTCWSIVLPFTSQLPEMMSLRRIPDVSSFTVNWLCLHIRLLVYSHWGLQVFPEYITKPLETIRKIQVNTVVCSHQRQYCVCVFPWAAHQVLQNCIIFGDCIMFVLYLRSIKLLFYLILSLLYSFKYQVWDRPTVALPEPKRNIIEF